MFKHTLNSFCGHYQDPPPEPPPPPPPENEPPPDPDDGDDVMLLPTEFAIVLMEFAMLADENVLMSCPLTYQSGAFFAIEANLFA